MLRAEEDAGNEPVSFTHDTGTPASMCAPRKSELIGRFQRCRRVGGLGGAVASDGGKVDRVGQGVRPAGICVGRQLGRAEAISGEDLCV